MKVGFLKVAFTSSDGETVDQHFGMATEYRIGVLAALLKFFEDSTGRTLVPDLTKAPGVGAWLSAWGNWAGLAVFLALAAFVYSSSKRETVEG